MIGERAEVEAGSAALEATILIGPINYSVLLKNCVFPHSLQHVGEQLILERDLSIIHSLLMAGHFLYTNR